MLESKLRNHQRKVLGTLHTTPNILPQEQTTESQESKTESLMVTILLARTLLSPWIPNTYQHMKVSQYSCKKLLKGFAT